MPRTISSALQAHLQGDLATMATCVKITRRDSTVLGFTSADHDLTFGGVVYHATDGLQNSAISSSTGTGVDNLEVAGVLSDARITEEDLLAGRYDGAEVVFYRLNWADLTMGAVTMFRGRIGEITLQDGRFTAEMRSLTQLLKQTVGDVTSPTCRVRNLGDAQCKVSLAGFTFTQTIASVLGPTSFTLSSDTHAAGYFDFGLVSFSVGANAGVTREIKTHSVSAGVAQIDLRQPFPFPVQAGDSATLIAGCDRRLATCRDKFNNAVNFHGEPYLPGNDKVFQVARPPQ